MEVSKLFRGLIVLQFLTIPAFALLSSVDPMYAEAPMTMFDDILLIYFIVYLISLILLFRFKSYGRALYTAAVFIGIPLSLGLPASSIPIGSAELWLERFAGALDGAMLAMMYLTSLKYRFEKVKE